MGNIRAGVSRVCITPPIGLAMAGYPDRDQLSKGIHDDLYSKAMVFDDGAMKLAVVTTDLLGLDREIVAHIRKIVERRTDIRGDNVMITASHTHSGYDLDTRRELLGMPVEDKPIEGLAKNEYMSHLRDIVTRWIAGAVYMANNGLEDARIGVGKGEVHMVGLNRRDPKDPMDPEVGVIRVDDARGKPKAVLMNFTCHPTVLPASNYQYSADYPAYAIKTVEAALGNNVQTMFTNGACGNVSTRFTRREQTFREAERLGSILGAEVVRATLDVKTVNQASLGVASKTIELPVKRFPTIEQAEKTAKTEKNKYDILKNRGSSYGELRVAYNSMEGAQMSLEWIRAGVGRLEKVDTEIKAIRIGDTILVFEPGELFTEIALDIKKNSKSRNTFVIGYANDAIGYIPTKIAYEEGLYETFVTLLSPDAGQIVRDTALQLIGEVITKH